MQGYALVEDINVCSLHRVCVYLEHMRGKRNDREYCKSLYQAYLAKKRVE